MKIFSLDKQGIYEYQQNREPYLLIDYASEAGFDAVKFQKRNIEKVYTKAFLDSSRESPWGSTQRDQKNGLEFSKEDYNEINQYCK